MKPKINVFTTLRNNVYPGVDPREGVAIVSTLAYYAFWKANTLQNMYFSVS